MRIGPEPTTDSFIAVMHGDIEGVIPGNALVVDPKKPFRKLNAFGNAFLNRQKLKAQGKRELWTAGVVGNRWRFFSRDEMSRRGEMCVNTEGKTEVDEGEGTAK